MINKNDDVLQHHGILGMRWGVRRSRDSDGLIIPGKYETKNGKPLTNPTLKQKKTQEKNKTGSADYKTTRELWGKGINNLSTEELRSLTQRMQLEQQYINLSKKASPVIIQRIDGIIDNALTGLATDAVKVGIKTGANLLFDRVKKKG